MSRNEAIYAAHLRSLTARIREALTDVRKGNLRREVPATEAERRLVLAEIPAPVTLALLSQ